MVLTEILTRTWALLLWMTFGKFWLGSLTLEALSAKYWLKIDHDSERKDVSSISLLSEGEDGDESDFFEDVFDDDVDVFEDDVIS